MLLMAICCTFLNEALMPIGASTSRHWKSRTIWEVVIMTWNDIENCLSWRIQAHDFVRWYAKCLPMFVWGKKELKQREEYNEICFYTLLYTSKHVSAQTAFQVKSKLLTLLFKVPPQSDLPTLPLLSFVPFTSHLLESTQTAHCAHYMLIQQNSNKHICSMSTICLEFY